MFGGARSSSPRIHSIDLNADGSFVGTINNTNMPSGASYDNYEGTETLHTSITLTGTLHGEAYVSDLEFDPNGNLLVGTRVGCGDWFGSYQHSAETRRLQLNGSTTFYTDNSVTFDISVQGVSAAEDGYGGVDSYTLADGTIIYAASSSDILEEGGPHGIAIWDATTTNAPLDPLGAFSYGYSLSDDPKGVGGDIDIYTEAYIPPCTIDADGLANTACSGTDAITLDLTPTGTSVGATYNVSVSGGGAATSISPTSGTYGVATTFTLNDNSAGGGNVTITITNVNGNCTRDVVVTDPGACPCVNPTADAPTTAQGTCTGNTANNNATITLSNITNADIAGIVAGADYSSGVAYNADASTDAALEAVAANTVIFSGLTHNTQYTVRVFNAANDCFTDFLVTSASITCAVSSCSSLLSNLNATGTVPDPTLAYVDTNPPFGCGSETMYPSPLVSAEQSGSFASAFCVPTPLPYRGLDESFQIVIGGDLIIPSTGGAEIEGRAAIGGNIQVDRTPYGIAESGGGTYVIGAAGDAVGVGGTVSGTGALSLGANNVGATYNIVSGGANTATLNNGTKVQNSASLPLDVSTIMTEVTCLSNDLSNATATGSFDINSFGNGFFVGNNTSNMEVFNVDGSLLNPSISQNSGYADVDLAATLVVNVSGATVDINYTVRAGRVDDPTFTAFGGGPLIYNVIWNFYEATDITLHTNFQGTIIAPLANVELLGNHNGRMYIGGNLTHSGAGTEIHNYPFTGNLSAYCTSCSTCTNPTADTPTTAQGTCTGATANNDATITLSNITNADIAGIVAGADYSSGVAYNADASTNAALEAVAANTVTFSGLTHNTQYTVRVFNGANDCFTDFVVTSASITCCVNPTADTPTTAQGTCTGATANNNATITLSNITNADIVGIVAGADYSSGVAYNADASTNAALEAVAANTVTFSGLTHNTQYTVRVFNAADDCFTDFTVTSASIICCPTQQCGTVTITINNN